MIQLTKLSVSITKDIEGTGYHNGLKEYISLKEIGRKLNYEGNSLKDFTKWISKQENLKNYIQIEFVPNKSSVTKASVILLENLKYVLPDLINKRNSKKINLIHQSNLIYTLLNYKGNYIIIDSHIPYISLDKFANTFKVSKNDCKSHLNIDLLKCTDFMFLITKLNLYNNHSNIIFEILEEFNYITELSNQILSNTLRNFLHNDNNDAFFSLP